MVQLRSNPWVIGFLQDEMFVIIIMGKNQVNQATYLLGNEFHFYGHSKWTLNLWKAPPESDDKRILGASEHSQCVVSGLTHIAGVDQRFDPNRV